jgi:hypothetical protein
MDINEDIFFETYARPTRAVLVLSKCRQGVIDIFIFR